MGLFDWFKKTPSNATVENDAIWLNKSTKLHGISQAVSRSLADPEGPAALILVAHFPDFLSDLQEVAHRFPESRAVTVVSAEALQNAGVPAFSSSGSQTIQIVVGERHLLQSGDEAILAFARALPIRCVLSQHLSLDDAVLFVGDRVKAFLQKLGMSEEEPIESKMVARQLRIAQRKIASRRVSDFPAESAKAWIERNCPNV
ncbi:MAG TPA: hypothetical protein VGJ26_22355 [Pirellulales bacterium]|jgi:hypothetical protein